MTEAVRVGWGPRITLLLALTASVLMHVPSVTARHREGDEVAYLGLSRAMGWDLSGYTVRDVPKVNEFPNRMYRSVVFPHPPLYPLLLKSMRAVQSALGGDGEAAEDDLGPLLAIGLGFKLLALWAMWRLLAGAGVGHALAACGVLLLSIAPILAFTSTRLLVDAPFAALLLSSVLAVRCALERDRMRDWALAGLVWSAFLNTKYHAIGYLPAALLLIAWAIPAHDRRAWLAAHAARLAVFASLVAFIGLSHHLRMWIAYGTPSIAPLMISERPLNDFVAHVATRSRTHVWLTLVLLLPCSVVWLSRRYWVELIARTRAHDSAMWPAALALYAFALTSVTMFTQERYYASFEPLLIAAFVVYARGAVLAWQRVSLGVLAALSAASMLGATVLCTFVDPGSAAAVVRPALTELSPAIAAWYFRFP